MVSISAVRGPVEADSLGWVLPHEHVIQSHAEFARDYPELSWPDGRQAALAQVRRVLVRLVECGVGTIIDCTAFGHGRDMSFLRDANDGIDLNIVVSTGMFFLDDHLPLFLTRRPPRPDGSDILTDMFVRDLVEGVADSGVRAENIKVCTDLAGLSPNNLRILRAAGAASAQTGTMITAHTHVQVKPGLQQVDVLTRAGADPGRIVISHAGDSDDLDYLRAIMDTGASIASDRFGLYRPGADRDARVNAVLALCAAGYADRILLSHDCVMFADYQDNFDDFPQTWVPTHLSDVIVPDLLSGGLDPTHLHQMIVANPRRLLTRHRG